MEPQGVAGGLLRLVEVLGLLRNKILAQTPAVCKRDGKLAAEPEELRT